MLLQVTPQIPSLGVTMPKPGGLRRAPLPSPGCGRYGEGEGAETQAHRVVSRPRANTATCGRMTDAAGRWLQPGAKGRYKVLEHRAGGSALRDLKDIQLAGVLERLTPVAEPDPHDLPVIVELLSNLGDLLACGQRVLLEVGVKSLYGLGGKGGAALAFLGGLASHKFHQVLLAFLVPEFGFIQPLLQHWLQLLRTLGRDVQLLKPVGDPSPGRNSESVLLPTPGVSAVHKGLLLLGPVGLCSVFPSPPPLKRPGSAKPRLLRLSCIPGHNRETIPMASVQ